MKIFQLLVFIFGLAVIFVLPLLHIISPKLVSFGQILIALFIFYVAVDLVTDKLKINRKSKNGQSA